MLPLGVTLVLTVSWSLLPQTDRLVRLPGDTGRTVDERGACAVRDGTDSDADGLSDACELALAVAFAPQLLADPADCSWVTDTAGRRLGGGYFFAVQPVARGGDTVRIAYLPAYFRDCGWRGMQRVLRLGRRNDHAGDSELILIDVARQADDRWRVAGIFLSAHCLGGSDGRCRWFRGAELAEVQWVESAGHRAPQVWVARDKHANYPTRAACESGHWRQERCAREAVPYRFPISGAVQNIGSRRSPAFRDGACVSGRDLPLGASGVTPTAQECLWRTARRFTGWQGDGDGSADAYGFILERFAGM